MLQVFPQLRKEELKGGLSFSDAKTLDFRLVIDTLKSGVAR